jgi:hypothetical protein
MQRISSAWVGPVREVNCLLSTAIISLVVQLNGLVIVVGQEPPRKIALNRPSKVPRAESSERSVPQVVAQFPAKSCR